MIAGTFRRDHPRIPLVLPGITGPLEVEFTVDTGFAGDLALSVDLLRQTDAVIVGSRDRLLAGGIMIRCPLYELVMEWGGEPRSVEVLVLDGDPLAGTELLRDTLLQIEVTEGGEVIVDVL
jgi:predicted aspartyl protease